LIPLGLSHRSVREAVAWDSLGRRLREHPETRAIPVVVVSAEATPRKIERFLGAGAVEYLTKPIDVPRFLEVVGRILERDEPPQ